MNPEAKFLTAPGLVPQNDGTNFRLDAPLVVQLWGQRDKVPKDFITDLASIPPLGFIGGIIMFVAHILGAWFPAWGWSLTGVGLFVCVMSIWLKPYGFYTYAAIYHDWIFQTHKFGFTVCNFWLLVLAIKSARSRWEWPLAFLIWFNVQFSGIGYWIYLNDKRATKNAHLK